MLCTTLLKRNGVSDAIINREKMLDIAHGTMIVLMIILTATLDIGRYTRMFSRIFIFSPTPGFWLFTIPMLASPHDDFNAVHYVACLITSFLFLKITMFYNKNAGEDRVVGQFMIFGHIMWFVVISNVVASKFASDYAKCYSNPELGKPECYIWRGHETDPNPMCAGGHSMAIAFVPMLGLSSIDSMKLYSTYTKDCPDYSPAPLRYSIGFFVAFYFSTILFMVILAQCPTYCGCDEPHEP